METKVIVEPDEAGVIREKFRGLIGLAPWRSELGFGTMVTMEFGAELPPQTSRGRSHGEWHLWIHDAVWRLECEGKVLTSSHESEEQMSGAVRTLEGNVLHAFDVTAELKMELSFSHDVVLHVVPMPEDAIHWMLFMPDGDVLTAGPGIRYSCGRADGPEN